jgi:hypothetical protein
MGVYYSTYFNKKTISYTENISSSKMVSDPQHASPGNPNGYYQENTNESVEKQETNYFDNKFNLFYSLNLGCKIKSFIPYVAAEMNYTNEGSTTIYVFKGGLRVLL